MKTVRTHKSFSKSFKWHLATDSVLRTNCQKNEIIM